MPGTPASGGAFDLEIGVLGRFVAASGDSELAVRSRKAQALLAYMAISPQPWESRERLAGLLWSESDETSARGSLRQVLRELRSAFDEARSDAFLTNRNDVRLDGRRIRLDLWEVIDQARRGRVHPLLLSNQRLSESLLIGYEELDPAFRAWLMVQRQIFHETLVRDLEQIILGYPEQPERATRAAEALVNLDPSHEGACRLLMRAHAAAGNIPRALKVYAALWDLLDHEYDMEPSDETQAVVAAIKAGPDGSFAAPPVASPNAVTPAAAAPADDDPSADRNQKPGLASAARMLLIVDTFDARGVPDNEIHIVHGFRHDLIARLVRFREWSVIGGSEDRLRRPTNTSSLPEYSLQATVYKAEGAFKLVLTLQDREVGRFVWSANYDLALTNWFEAQQTIVRRIAVALNVQLSAERLAQITGRPDVSLDVLDRWLLGQSLSFRWQPPDETRAEEIFQSIIDEAPDFAPAYSSLVQIKNSYHLVFPGRDRTRENARESLAIAKQAVQIDPLDSRAQLCLAWSYALNGQHDHAEVSYGLAYDLNPNDAWTLVSTALGLSFCGRRQAAHDIASQALTLCVGPSPVHWGYQAVTRFMIGDLEGCVEAADRANDAISNLPAWKAAALGHLDRIAEAKAEGRRFVELIRSNWHGRAPPEDEAIAAWLLHCFPIRERESWERLRDGLSLAGVPAPRSAPALP
ncbi:trifolitoxin synthesis, TfuA [Thalassobaculum fulvum]|uniref:Trifolitoxin synthesis, TfuA n=1 Tax=Thalassobaculum fulvum TaxID=1633335 RepID=A0A919CSD5_9PROT|nr:BTAD domain-containing putative transcriptional regulator [Thalassobaculum fulvum]GHD63778.1 trifolitoxin synthesis, TfuA [Thalassobaculum fulvum]